MEATTWLKGIGAVLTPILGDRITMAVLVGSPGPIASTIVFCLLTKYWGPTHWDRETRCRKCGYILRGITEPRCPECGERI